MGFQGSSMLQHVSELHSFYNPIILTSLFGFKFLLLLFIHTSHFWASEMS